jgi:hypothetical protein
VHSENTRSKAHQDWLDRIRNRNTSKTPGRKALSAAGDSGPHRALLALCESTLPRKKLNSRQIFGEALLEAHMDPELRVSGLANRKWAFRRFTTNLPDVEVFWIVGHLGRF